jgi:hypothetical protein
MRRPTHGARSSSLISPAATASMARVASWSRLRTGYRPRPLRAEPRFPSGSRRRSMFPSRSARAPGFRPACSYPACSYVGESIEMPVFKVAAPCRFNLPCGSSRPVEGLFRRSVLMVCSQYVFVMSIMTATTTAPPAAPVPPDPARGRGGDSAPAGDSATVRQLRLLEQLADAGMGLARAAGVRATAPAGAEDSADINDRIDAFAKVARAVRLTIGLEVKLQADFLAGNGGASTPAAPARGIGRDQARRRQDASEPGGGTDLSPDHARRPSDRWNCRKSA